MYHASKTSLNKRFADGFNVLVPYTFGKNLGNADGHVRSYIKNAHNLSADLPLRTFSNGCPSVICTNYPSGERGGKRHKWDWGGNPGWLRDCGDYHRPNFGLPRVNPNVRGADHKYGNGSGAIEFAF